MLPNFSLEHRDKNSNARAGTIITSHGEIETPVFMPVGTQATVKGLHHRDLADDVNSQIILGNTYHLYLRPGTEVIEKAGGIHKFMNWERNILTDSGGYQVYSLSNNRKITDDGVWFKSHIDGSKHFFSPETAVEIQRKIGANIIMAFDECPPYPCDYSYTNKSMKLTHNWLDRCIKTFKNEDSIHGFDQIFFPIVQGGTYKDLRRISAEYITSKDCFGNAIGGLSVGEPHNEMYEMTDIVCNILPVEKPRYLMGVGTPINLLENISLGIDMFDCVMPTRNGRNGMLFTWNGVINIKNKKWEFDFSPIDESGSSWVDKYYSKSYLRHLFTVNESLGKHICSIHNLKFYADLMKIAREKIISGEFLNWKNSTVSKLNNRL
jgi:queuine tRNA-ribosyltransferase